MMTGRLQQTIKLSKYQGRRGWAAIFGPVLVGFRDANAEAFQAFDLIVTSLPRSVRVVGRATT
jgi:hypothetical protein